MELNVLLQLFFTNMYNNKLLFIKQYHVYMYENNSNSI